MDRVNLIGTIAAILTTVSFLPQMARIHRTRHTSDLSLSTFIIFSAGISLWMIYGILINSFPVIAANAVTLMISAYIISMKLRYK